MISYREKQLIAVQKMLQDNSRMMLEQTCSLNKNNSPLLRALKFVLPLGRQKSTSEHFASFNV